MKGSYDNERSQTCGRSSGFAGFSSPPSPNSFIRNPCPLLPGMLAVQHANRSNSVRTFTRFISVCKASRQVREEYVFCCRQYRSTTAASFSSFSRAFCRTKPNSTYKYAYFEVARSHHEYWAAVQAASNFRGPLLRSSLHCLKTNEKSHQ
jgi:hypothetical protein